MSSADYYHHYHHQPQYRHPRHDSSHLRTGDAEVVREKLAAMRDSLDYRYPSSTSTSSQPYYSTYEYEPRAPPPPPRRSAATLPSHTRRSRKQTWPPSPSVEEENEALTKEVRSWRPVHDDEPPENTRGAVDQETLLEDIELPDNRRYVLVSDLDAPEASGREARRRSFVERGNMAYIQTDVRFDDAPAIPERVSTPYAYTAPKKESTAPSRADFLSPEPLTPAASKNNVFDDSDTDLDDTSHLRAAERKPARYSFVKSDLQKEDLRTNLYDAQPKPEPRRPDSSHRRTRAPSFRKEESFGSSKESPYGQSPRSSSSSLNNGQRKSRPAPVDTGYHTTTRTPSRPASPQQRAPSPKLPPRLRDSPPGSRPSSRGNPRTSSPLNSSTTLQPPSPGRLPVSDVDRHATYPPATTSDRSRPPSRMNRYDTMPVPNPRIDVQSPSPARAPTAPTALPYPVDDRPLDVFMPSVEQYQFDHSKVASPRQTYPDSPRASASSLPGSPRLRDEPPRPQTKTTIPEEPARTRRTRANSARSQHGFEDRREQLPRSPITFDLNKPLPTCPRKSATTKYDDWYSLKGYNNFDICPKCYDGVFADTPFSVHFLQTRLGERPVERFCDFGSSPWIRLAWLLTIRQRRPSLELLYLLADVSDNERPCPGDRELASDRVTWYGIPDQRDGIHVADFAICSSDKRMIEALLPTMRGYFTRLPNTYQTSAPETHMCSLRTSSRRFPKYLDLLVDLETESQDLNQRPNINRFIQMARENAFKGECAQDKAYIHKPWYFIPELPEFTVCEECFDSLVWPAMQSRSTIARLFNKTLQLVSNEDPDVGSSCCLYSPRMKRVFDVAVKDADFPYLRRKAVDRKKMEASITRKKMNIMKWMAGLDRGSVQWEHAKSEMKDLDTEWAKWE